MKDESFRADLYYPLTEVIVRLPPLRDRLGDIPVFSCGLVRRVASWPGYPVPSIAVGALDVLAQYDWPGNVRELQNVLTRALIISRGAGVGSD